MKEVTEGIKAMHKNEKEHVQNVEDYFLGCLCKKHDLDKDAKKQKAKKKASKKPAVFYVVGLDYDSNVSECVTMSSN